MEDIKDFRNMNSVLTEEDCRDLIEALNEQYNF